MGKLVFIIITFFGLFLFSLGTQNAFAVIIGGIDFPDGISSFADALITFDPLFNGGPAPTAVLDPTKSIGPPDFTPPAQGNAVSIGSGGLLEVLFVDNLLTNSGDSSFDLHIFEVGADAEHTFVSIRPDAATALLLGPAFDTGVPGMPATIGDGFYEVGVAIGGTDSIDIDSFFPAAPPGTYAFDAVQIIDDPLMVVTGTPPTRGAEIDAVGAIDSRGIATITTVSSGILPYPDPNLGDVKYGRGHDNGFCVNLDCVNVDGLFNHFPLTTIPQGSTQTFSVLVNCPRGSNTCNHISIAGALSDADFYDDRWSVTVKRQPGTDNWILTVYNPFGEISDEVTVTVQPVNNSFLTASFNIQFLIPGSIGNYEGITDPQENVRHIHVTVWDDNKGASNYIFNDGIYVDDIYAYPQVETSYDAPIEVEPLCLNENPNKRYTCAFDKVREWTIKNAEMKLDEINS